MLVYYLAIVAVLVRRSRCYLIHSDKVMMQSAEGLGETENAILLEDHVDTVLNEIGCKGKIGGEKRRTQAEIAKELPDVSKFLHHDAPVNCFEANHSGCGHGIGSIYCWCRVHRMANTSCLRWI